MNKAGKTNPVFREVQLFRQAWILLIISTIALFIWYAFVKQIFMRSPVGTRPAPDIVILFFWIAFGVGMPALFFFCKLITEVRDDGIYIRFFPLHTSFHRIGFDELKTYKILTYRPIIEYGGWGIRRGSKGKAYNVRGNRGGQLEFLKGKQYS